VPTKQFLCVAGAGEQSLGRRLGVDARADEKKLRAAAEGPEFARHACTPRSALPGRLFRQSCERRGATFVDRLGHLRHLAAQDVGEPSAERTQKVHRIDAVADDEFPG
jgi:hypothetical protein